jgi:hypothetical protein
MAKESGPICHRAVPYTASRLVLGMLALPPLIILGGALQRAGAGRLLNLARLILLVKSTVIQGQHQKSSGNLVSFFCFAGSLSVRAGGIVR